MVGYANKETVSRMRFSNAKVDISMDNFNKFDEHRKAKYLGGLRHGLRLGEAAKYAGVSRCLVWSYGKQHPAFLEECRLAEECACDKVESALMLKALGGNMTAIIFWLCNRSPERWRDKRNPVQVVTAAPESHQSLDSIRAELEEALLKGRQT